jgi:tRNA modification GTPase
LNARNDLIVAVASAPGRALRGIIRLSGERTHDLLRDLLRFRAESKEAGFDRARRASGTRGEEDLDQACDRVPQFSTASALLARLTLHKLQIPCICLLSRGPRSYTGEDAAELQLPGNPVLLQRVIDALLDAARARGVAARHAEPGEFTARAYLNGKLSLTQAEGVAAAIAAQSDAELRAANMLLSGAIGELAHQLADELATVLALVEAGIDFTDQEDVVPIAPAALLQRIEQLYKHIDAQLHRAVGMESLQAIPWVVLTGRPNTGKSTLFNALLGRQRAVVSDIAGTTRDVLAEPLTIATPHGPAEVMLIDLAGCADDPTAMNRLMQAAAREALQRAELVIDCQPANEPRAASRLHDALTVVTKCDLSCAKPRPAALRISAVTGEGLDNLRGAIALRLADRAVNVAADALALRPRHEAALRSAADHLVAAIDLLRHSQGDRSLARPELVAASMRAALDNLAELAGDITPDDVLGRVFATFCVGK